MIITKEIDLLMKKKEIFFMERERELNDKKNGFIAKIEKINYLIYTTRNIKNIQTFHGRGIDLGITIFPIL